MKNRGRSEQELLEELNALKAENNLLKQEKTSWKKVVESTFDLVFKLTLNSKADFLYISPSVEKNLGYKSNELIGESIYRLIYPEDKETFIEHVLLCKYTEGKDGVNSQLSNKKDTIEYRIVSKEGIRKYFQSRIIIQNEELLVVSRDITDYTLLKKELNRKEHFFSESGKIAKVGAWELLFPHMEFNITDNLRSIIEMPENQKLFLGDIFQLVHPDDRSHAQEVLQQAMQGESFDFKYRITTGKGNIKWLHNKGICEKENGEIRRIKGVLQDITQVKLAEREILKINNELKQYKDNLEKKVEERSHKLVLFSKALESSLACIAITDKHGIIEYANGAFLKTTGYNTDEVVGKSFSFLKSGVHSFAFYTKLWNTILEGNTWKGEICNKKKNGELYWESAIISPVKNSENKITHFITVKEDITQKRKVQEELEKANVLSSTALKLSNTGYWYADFGTDPLKLYAAAKTLVMYGMDPSSEGTGVDVNVWLNGVAAVDPKTAEREYEALRYAIENRESQYERVYPFKRLDDGKLVWFRVIGEKWYDKTGKLLRIYGFSQDITEQVNKENELIESRENLQALFDNMTSGLTVSELIHDDQGKAIDFRIISCNNAYKKILTNFSESDIGKLFSELYDISNIDLNIFDNVVKTRVPFQAEVYWAPIAKFLSLKVFPDNQGRFFSLFEDISERKRQEAEIIESREQFEILFENMVTGFAENEVIFNDEGKPIDVRVLRFNTALKKMVPSLSDEIKGKRLKELSIPSLLDLNIVADIATTGIPKRFQIEKDNKHYSLNVFSPKKNHYAVLVEDVTQRVKQEEVLQASEQRFRNLFDNAPVAYLSLDINGNYIDFNNWCLNLLGYKRDQLLGKSFSSVWSNTYKSEFDKIITKIKQSGYISTELILLKKDGSEIVVVLEGRVQYNQEETPIRIHCILVDIHERKQQELQIKQKEQNFRNLFEQNMNAIFILNEAGSLILDCNKKGVELLHAHSKNDIVDKSPIVFGPEIQSDGKVTIEKIKEQIENTRKVGHCQLQYQLQDTNKRLFDSNINMALTIYNEQIGVLCMVDDITERKALEEKLRENELRWQFSIEGSNIGIWDWDFESGKVHLSKQLCNILGYEEGEVPSNWIKDLSIIHPEDRDIVLNGMQYHIKNKTDLYQNEHRVVCKDGSLKWVLDRGKVVKWASNGSPIRVVGTYTDISDMKRMQDELSEAKNAADSIIDNNPNPVVVVDLSTSELLRYNPAAKELMNLSTNSSNKFFTADDSNIIISSEDGEKLMRKLIEDGAIINFEVQVYDRIRKETRDSLISLQHIRYESRDCAVAAMLDITEIKQIQNELKQQTELRHILTDISSNYINIDINQLDDAINEALKRIGTFINSNRAAIYSYNQDLTTYKIQYQWTKDGVQPITDKLQEIPVSNLASEWVKKHLNNQVVYYSNINQIEDVELRYTLEEDGYKSLLTIPMLSANRLIGFISFDIVDSEKHYTKQSFELLQLFSQILINISNRKEFENQIIVEKEKAESASTAKSAFLANMSHEIRTPMNAIIGFSEILSKKVEDPTLENYVNSIYSSGKTLLKLINDILDLSKIEAGKLELNYEVVNLRNVFRDIRMLFNQKVQEKGLILHSNISNEVPEALLIDELRLNQVLINVVSNAIKFTQDGSISIQADIKNVTPENGTLIISITDTGIGIAKDKLEMIFEDFKQEDESISRQYGGTGLGLSISRKIVHLFNGSFQVESKEGKGSTFIIELPDVKIVNDSPPVQEEEFNDSEICFEPAKILIVDDVKSNRDLLASHLLLLGFEVYEAVDGASGFTQAVEVLPDLIFMDLRMPGEDGGEVTKRLKLQTETNRIPVIACTASVLDAPEKLLHSGIFDGSLTKPILSNDLIGILIKYFKWKQKEETSTHDRTLHFSESDLDYLINKLSDIWDQKKLRKTVKGQKTLAELIIQTGTELNNKDIVNLGEDFRDAIIGFNLKKVDEIIKKLEEVLN
nr:PAS domain S-box protein [uncultured Carboxylicivirga sp.]